MAPPVNRRPGYSRRAQYSTFFGYVAAVLGLVVGIVLLVVSLWFPDSFAGFRTAASTVVEPVGGATARTRAAGRGVFDNIAGFATSGQRVARLKRELAASRAQLAKLQSVKEENRRLKAVLGITQTSAQVIAVTRIVASTASSTRRLGTIGAGTSHGVRRGMPVRSDTGLIGRVLDAGRFSSTVLLITDSASQVPVRRAKDSVAGFAQGVGDGTLKVRLLTLGLNPLRKGDVLVTSGSGGLFQPGTPTAVVTRLTRDGAIARVLSDPADTSFVLVEPTYQATFKPREAPAGEAAQPGEQQGAQPASESPAP